MAPWVQTQLLPLNNFQDLSVPTFVTLNLKPPRGGGASEDALEMHTSLLPSPHDQGRWWASGL